MTRNANDTINDGALRRLRDHAAISDLVMRRGRSADAKDPDAILRCHVPGSRDEHGIFNGTIEEFVEHLRVNHYSGDTYGPQQHFVSNLLIDFVDDDVAEAESLHIAIHRIRRTDGEFDVEIGGRYADRYERHGDSWLIVSRAVIYDWSRVLPAPVGSSTHLADPRVTRSE